MEDYIQENKRSLFILACLLLLLLIILYFILLHPLLNDLSTQERQLIALENEKEILTEKINNFNNDVKDTDWNQLIYENKIPTKRELDEYILALQQAELITDSKLLEIEFMYDSSLPVNEEGEEVDAGDVVGSANEEFASADIEDDRDSEEGSETEIEETLTIDPVIINEKPDELEVLTVRVRGASKDFDDFIDFIKAIEEQERISVVSSLSFTKPTEDELLFSEYPFIALSFRADLTTFYYPN